MIYVLLNFTNAYFQQFNNYHHLTESHRKFSHDNHFPILHTTEILLNKSYVFSMM
jgi:hypothetical protein